MFRDCTKAKKGNEKVLFVRKKAKLEEESGISGSHIFYRYKTIITSKDNILPINNISKVRVGAEVDS